MGPVLLASGEVILLKIKSRNINGKHFGRLKPNRNVVSGRVLKQKKFDQIVFVTL